MRNAEHSLQLPNSTHAHEQFNLCRRDGQAADLRPGGLPSAAVSQIHCTWEVVSGHTATLQRGVSSQQSVCSYPEVLVTCHLYSRCRHLKAAVSCPAAAAAVNTRGLSRRHLRSDGDVKTSPEAGDAVPSRNTPYDIYATINPADSLSTIAEPLLAEI